jgi:hypothetical protein
VSIAKDDEDTRTGPSCPEDIPETGSGQLLEDSISGRGMPEEIGVLDESLVWEELDSATEELDSSYSQPQGIMPQVICSEEVGGSATSPLVAEVVSQAVSAALAITVTADTPSIEASFFCVDGDHSRLPEILLFLISIVFLLHHQKYKLKCPKTNEQKQFFTGRLKKSAHIEHDVSYKKKNRSGTCPKRFRKRVSR